MSRIEHRVRYADTDHFGVVYYSRYLEWFEAGRTEILREKGITYAELEKKGMFAPVVEVKANFLKPVHYDQMLVIETSIGKIGNSSVRFDYKVFCKDVLVAEGYTVNVFVDKDMKPIKVPSEIQKIS
ncbi:MAG TPA: thioesterase family protein [Candidatus Nanoarchaeia archaeon]|nr:thioesterase family protein [Candidatus Nanoarchaeia archaeon]